MIPSKPKNFFQWKTLFKKILMNYNYIWKRSKSQMMEKTITVRFNFRHFFNVQVLTVIHSILNYFKGQWYLSTISNVLMNRWGQTTVNLSYNAQLVAWGKLLFYLFTSKISAQKSENLRSINIWLVNFLKNLSVAEDYLSLQKD